MGGAEILNIAVTVGLAQLGCDLIANWMVYSSDSYKRAVGALERSRWKLNKAEEDAKKNEKHAKRLQRAKDDFGEACSEVARRHTGPSMISSVFFVILLRILGTEHKGNVMAILPFVPFNLFRKLSARGLDWTDVPNEALNGLTVETNQATSFLFIYLLCSLSVKFFVNKAFGAQAPTGADNGIMSIMESPRGQKIMKSMGIDPDDLKAE